MDFENNSEKDRKGKVVDLGTFRKRKETEDEFGRGRKPLYVSHLNGKITGSPHLKTPGEGHQDDDFGDRLQRIRSSLDKTPNCVAGGE